MTIKSLLGALVAAASLAVASPASAGEPAVGPGVSDRQVAVLLLVDYARSYGYQVMMARIEIDRVKAQLARDEASLAQKRLLFARNIVPEIEIEIGTLKDDWNRAQLVVAEKNLDYVGAEYQAMVRLAHHFGGEPATAAEIYATFRSGWDAGCAKGPDEIAAAKARLDFMDKVVARARQLNAKHLETASSLSEKETERDIAASEYSNRSQSGSRCRALLFPSLEDIEAIPSSGNGSAGKSP